jgi:hypothetical protein
LLCRADEVILLINSLLQFNRQIGIPIPTFHYC